MSAAEQPAPDDDLDAPLRLYLDTKQQVADILRDIRQFAEHAAPWAAEGVRGLLVRLAEDHFQLVVVGQFKRGKTSLMNAIIGRPLLPTGVIPVTSVITALRYGPTVRVVIRRAGLALAEEIPVSELVGFITEQGNPGNRKHVVSVDVEAPTPFLRRGLRFIDTPGVGSSHEQNTATTLAFLPEADAAIFVTGADAPLSEAELAFLDSVRSHVRKLFLVVNKIDQISTSERDMVLTYTRGLLAHRLGVDAVRLFPISATGALGADAAEVAASGLPALESALADFLNEDRQRVFLVAVLDRASRLLEEMRFALDLGQRAHAGSVDVAQKTDDLSRRYMEQEERRRAIVDRAAGLIMEWQVRVLDPALARFRGEADRLLSLDLTSTSTSWTSAHAGDTWLRTQLEQRALIWLSGMRDLIAQAGQTIARMLQPEVAALLHSTFGIAGSVFGTTSSTRDDPDADPGDEQWQWIPPLFVPPDVIPRLGEISDNSWHAPFPNALTVRLAARRIARRLPVATAFAADVLRDVILEHLRYAAGDLGDSSSRALDAERQRVAAAIGSRRQLPAAAAAADPGAGMRCQSLMDRVTLARDALLRNDPLIQPSSGIDLRGVSAHASMGPSSPPATTPAPAREPRVVTGTCTICAAVSDAVFDFLCHHQYAIAADRAENHRFMASRGLCPTHTWHLERLGSKRGLSSSYPPLLDDTATRILATSGGPRAAALNAIRSLVPETDACPACGARRKTEQATAERLVQQFGSADGRASFQRSQWLCLTHLRLVLTAADDELTGDLLRAHARRLRDLAESMREYVLKVDARRRALITDDEERACRQALVLLVGERYLVATMPEE